MRPGQRYYCRDCRTERVLPESPIDGPNQVRTGCPTCEAITTHKAVGRP